MSVPSNETPINLLDKSFAVKIYTTAIEYDYKYPWKAPSIRNWSGSGFVIDGNKIVTNAHVAGGAVFMEVRTAHDSVRYRAKTLTIGHECDLAILEVENPEFWEKVKAIEIADTAERKTDVEVHGFPMGGETFCVTEGIVSRIENDYYAHSGKTFLSSQVSAAINPGNSGGAVVSDGKVVGVAFQGYTRGQNIGYMIPSSILQHFLRDALKEAHKYTGFPGLAIETQTLESSYLRKHLGMNDDQSGVMITAMDKLSAATSRLRKEDVILAIDGIPLNNDGTVNINPMKNVDYNYLINRAELGDTLKFKVLRNGYVQNVDITLTNNIGATRMLMPQEYGKQPTYYISSGIVFQPVTLNYMMDTRAMFENREKTERDEQIITINSFLRDDANMGYRGFNNCEVKYVNGVRIKNMRDLVSAMENNWGNTHEIVTSDNRLIVVPKLSAVANQKILDTYAIADDRSKDLREEADFVLNSKVNADSKASEHDETENSDKKVEAPADHSDQDLEWPDFDELSLASKGAKAAGKPLLFSQAAKGKAWDESRLDEARMALNPKQISANMQLEAEKRNRATMH